MIDTHQEPENMEQESAQAQPQDQIHAKGTALQSAIRMVRSQFLHIAAFSFTINVLVMAVPLFMIQVFDRVLSSHSRETLFVLAMATIAALAVMAALDLVRSRLMVRIGHCLEQTLGPVLVASQQNHRLDDLKRLKQFMAGPGVLTLMDTPWAPFFLLVIFLLHPTLGWVALGGAALLLILAVVAEFWLRNPVASGLHAADGVARLTQSIGEDDGIIAATGMQRALSRRWQELQAKSSTHQLRVADRAALTGVIGRFVRLFLQVTMMATAVLLVIGNEISAGAMVATLVILGRALSPFERAIDLWRSVVATRVSLVRLLRDLPLTSDPSCEDFGEDPDQPSIILRKVAAFPKSASEPIFTGLSFKIEGGGIFGITGPSGDGKSTFGRLLAGLDTPDHGSIRHTGANGHMPKVGYLAQSPQLMPGTIADNIAHFTKAGDSDLREAAKLAGADEAILNLPRGYATPIDECAQPLPAGLLQRIALARAFFGRPGYLVLDEPYTHLDNEGVANLMSALDEIKKRGAVVIIISQRPSVLAHCARVLVLRDGLAKFINRGKRNLRVLTGGDVPEDGNIETRSKVKRASGGKR